MTDHTLGLGELLGMTRENDLAEEVAALRTVNADLVRALEDMRDLLHTDHPYRDAGAEEAESCMYVVCSRITAALDRARGLGQNLDVTA